MSNDFQKHRDNIVRMPCLALPWGNLDSLKNIKLNKKITTICVVGMGGSSLGAKALITAVKCPRDAESSVKCIFLDNIDPDFVNETLSQIDLKKTLFLLISKSGETIEIISLALILFSKIKSAENFIVITDDIKSSLAEIAKKRGIDILQSPKNVPGRFSVLSVVGLLPAALAGIPVQKVLAGAQKASWLKAYDLACKQYEYFRKGKFITVIFPYCENLNFFADWYIQLLSESIGKSNAIGITTVKAIGAKDQHSQLQLFLDGPDDKFYIMIPPPSTKNDIKISSKSFTLNDLFNAEYESSKKAFRKKKKPFAEISFKEITPETLGEAFFFFELEIAFLGSLFGINIQNQPAVELSKKYAKSILK
ncbi:hypothetical protein HZC21_00205 [Candidatus Peregrinibacteria bacterium]|nr:hypothetical protein [Candidatus Peregrinibacteria bacterium]